MSGRPTAVWAIVPGSEPNNPSDDAVDEPGAAAFTRRWRR
jgi:hypothetical protein